MDYRKKLDVLRSELDRVMTHFEKLGEKLIEEGKKVKHPGYPPDPLLLEEARLASSELNSLINRVKDISESLFLSYSTNGYFSLVDLQQLYEHLEKEIGEPQTEVQLEKARELVEKSFYITFPPEAGEEKERFYSFLRGYLDVICGDERGEATELGRRMAEGIHPLNALWQFARGNELEVKETAELFQSVAGEFGLVPALSAVRGELVFPCYQEEITGTQAEEAPGRELQKSAQKDLAPMEHGEIFGVSGLQEATESPPWENDSSSDDLNQEGPVEGELKQGWLEEIINLMLEEGKLEPAFWLAGYAEMKFGGFFLPPLLLKAVELADIVKGEKGPAAEWLSYIYTALDYESLIEKETSGDRKTGLSLLAISSLLRPAVAAPESGAPQLLSRLCDKNGPVENYCSFLKKAWFNSEPVDFSRVDRKLETLSREAQEWERRNRGLSLASGRAARLWDRLKDEGGLLNSIIKPVCQNDTGKLEEVYRLVRCLRRDDNLKKEIAMLYRREQGVDSDEIFHIPGSWQVLVRLEEALKMAERWLKLHQNRSFDTNLAPLDRERLPAVLGMAIEELKSFIQKHDDSSFARSSAILCRRSFKLLEKELREGIKKGEALSAEELASEEISKKPVLKFQPGWKPADKTVERMGRALLELLQENEPAGDIKADENRRELAREERESYSAQEKSFALSFNGEDPLEEGILSQQEKDFIREVLKDMGEEFFDSGKDNGEDNDEKSH